MNRRLAMKTATYGVIHVTVATSIAYLLTGDFAAAAGIGLLEPIVQTGVFAIHERIWEATAITRATPLGSAMGGRGRACCLPIAARLTSDNPDLARAA